MAPVEEGEMGGTMRDEILGEILENTAQMHTLVCVMLGTFH